jgi:hypothetical protein
MTVFARDLDTGMARAQSNVLMAFATATTVATQWNAKR